MLESTLWLAKMTCATLKSLKMPHVSVTPLLNTLGSVLMLVGILWTGEPQNCAVSITGDTLTSCSVTNKQQALRWCWGCVRSYRPFKIVFPRGFWCTSSSMKTSAKELRVLMQTELNTLKHLHGYSNGKSKCYLINWDSKWSKGERRRKNEAYLLACVPVSFLFSWWLQHFYSQLLTDWVFIGVWLVKHLLISSCLVVRSLHHCNLHRELHRTKHVLDYGV